jgi:hypothetical protein
MIDRVSAAMALDWKGYQPPKKGQPKYAYATMKELRQHAEKNNLSISQVIMANEVAVSGKSEAEINAFLDKVAGAMLATVKAGLSMKDDVLPGPIKLHTKAGHCLGAGPGRQVRKRPSYRADFRVRPGGLRGKCAWSPGYYRADGRFGRCHAGNRLCPGQQQTEATHG